LEKEQRTVKRFETQDRLPQIKLEIPEIRKSTLMVSRMSRSGENLFSKRSCEESSQGIAHLLLILLVLTKIILELVMQHIIQGMAWSMPGPGTSAAIFWQQAAVTTGPFSITIDLSGPIHRFLTPGTTGAWH
jgi:hypothetical protein